MERSVYVREENIRRAFAYFDQDKDGCITMQNLVEIMGRCVNACVFGGALSWWGWTDACAGDSTDACRSTSQSNPVHRHATTTQTKHSEDKAREVLGATDLNGDGAISYDEFKVLFVCVWLFLGVCVVLPIAWLGWLICIVVLLICNANRNVVIAQTPNPDQPGHDGGGRQLVAAHGQVERVVFV